MNIIEAIRKRPALYVSSTGYRGLHHLIEELINFSIANNSRHIELVLSRDLAITFIDKDYSIPLESDRDTNQSHLQTVLSESFVTDNVINNNLAVVNALAEWLEIQVSQQNKTYHQRYEKGQAVTELTEKAVKSNFATAITFKPDGDIFNTHFFNLTLLKIRLQQLAYLNSGVEITLGNCTTEQEEIIRFLYPKGIEEYLAEINRSRQQICAPRSGSLRDRSIYIKQEKNNLKIEIALQWCEPNEAIFLTTFAGNVSYQRYWQCDRSDDNSLYLASFVNQLNTSGGGTHVAGTIKGIMKALYTACQQYYPYENLNTNWYHIERKLAGIIALDLPKPEYGGSTKWRLLNPEVSDAIDKLVASHLTKYFQQHPQIVREILR